MDRTSRSPSRRRTALLAAAGLVIVTLGAAGCITSAGVSGNVLTIVGSGGPDTIVVRLKAGDANTLEVDDGADGSADHSFDRSTFNAIVVDGGGGDDVIAIDQVNGLFTDTEITTLLGNAGNDQLAGGSGAETLDGGAGDDLLDGNTGNDTVVGGGDVDVISWNPGDGSDTIDGGTSADRLVFNASNAAEIITISESAGHALLTRNVGNITLDLDAMETLDLALLGGTDSLLVDDLSATDVDTVTSDLAATGGFDDGALDEVRVPAPATVGRSGSAATATGAGVGALVRVRNGSPTDRLVVAGTAGVDQVQITGTPSPDPVLATVSGVDVVVTGATPGLPVVLNSVDQLVVDLGDGNDQFSTAGNLAGALTDLVVSGGAGRDTIAGGNGVDLLIGGPGADAIDGNQGNDTIFGSDDDDLVTWDPGDGDDTIDGGSGTDQLTFNGSNASEILDVSNVGGQARLTRNIANITLGLAGIEAAELNLLGGTDTVVVHDLTGTSLGFVGVNLTGTLGSTVADGLAEQVTVDGTTGDDIADVVAIGPAVEVTGLDPVVRITGADPTLDTLTVNGLAGADTLSSSPAAAALILLSLLP